MNLNPYHPLIDAKNVEIANSIELLEAKIRERKQLDHDIDYLLQYELRKRDQHEEFQKKKIAQQAILHSQIKYRSYIEDKIATEKLKFQKQEQDAIHSHMRNMNLLDQQKLMLDRQRMKEIYIQQLQKEDIAHKKIPNFIYEDEDNEDRFHHPHQKQEGKVQKVEKEEKDEKSSPIKAIKDVTPYKTNKSIIKQEKTKAKPNYEPGQFMQNPIKKVQFSSGKKQKLRLPNSNKKNSPYHGSNNKSSRKATNRTKIIQRSQSRIRSSEEQALKKIENRLRLSEIVYQDSKFRNKKHEHSHLHMTYENEERIRRDIKERLNNHPQILKKHNMVIQ